MSSTPLPGTSEFAGIREHMIIDGRPYAESDGPSTTQVGAICRQRLAENSY